MSLETDTLSHDRDIRDDVCWQDTGDTAGLRLRDFRRDRDGKKAHRTSLSMVLSANIAKEILAAPPAAVEASVWSTQTFGSRFQSVVGILSAERHARESHRSILVAKCHFGQLTDREAILLDELQRESAEHLAFELEQTISYLRKIKEKQRDPKSPGPNGKPRGS